MLWHFQSSPGPMITFDINPRHDPESLRTELSSTGRLQIPEFVTATAQTDCIPCCGTTITGI